MDAWAIFDSAVACHRQGALAEAESLYQTLLGTYPDHGVVNHLMGVLRAQQERFDEAVPFYEASLRTKPGDPAVLLDAGNALQKLGRFDEALRHLDAALAVRPGFFEAMSNRGNIYLEMKQFEKALESFDHALAIRPDSFEIQFNRGLALHQLQRFAEALTIFELLHARDPRHPKVFGEALASALRLGDWTRKARLAAEIPVRITDGITRIQPLVLMNYSSDPQLLRRCAHDMVETFKPRAAERLWTGNAYRHARKRLAYLSSDFRVHPVAAQVTQVLEMHDRTRFEVIGLSSGPDDGSPFRARMMGAVDQFYDVRTFSPRRIAEKLRALEVDILVDLNGLTEGTSLAALALRPCPVQATWLGYPGTTGADFVDYLIADPVVAPASQQQFYSEKLIHLPDSFFPMDSTRPTGATPTRAQAGLPQDGFVFCCFNNNWKIAAPVFDIWMRLLRDVPASILWLKDHGHSAAGLLRHQAQARGIAQERLVFAGTVPLAEHLARHALADLFLDTLPYGAHATAADALWAGLPVLTRMGETFPGRVGASLLTAAGLPELIAQSPEEYEAMALDLARNQEKLKTIRDKLAASRATAPLFDTARFTRNLESAYEKMLTEKT